MGMQSEAPSAPDTFGLPEFFVTDIFTEITGSNVRIVCGVRRSGTVHWLYSAVMPADMLLAASTQCREAALQTFNVRNLLESHGAH